MSRLTQAMAYINLEPSKLTQEWIKSNMTSIAITDELKALRKKKKKR